VLKSLLSLASPAGPRGRLSILVFHRVLPEADSLFPEVLDAARFEAVCGWLRAWFVVLPLDEAVARLRAGELPARALAISFDDGYADNHDVALPILTHHGLKATFFIATGFLDGGRMWNDTAIEAVRGTSLPALDLRGLISDASGGATFSMTTIDDRRAAVETILRQAKYLPADERERVVTDIARRAEVDLPDGLMLGSEQVRSLHRAGMQIGAHTVSHPILARLNDGAARQEMAASKAFLEQILGETVSLFAYPNGKPGEDYSPRTVSLAQEVGFTAAVSTAWGAARTDSDMFQLPRFTPWDRTRLRFGGRLLANLRRRPQ
jgi:peptidoglycan/xylan/chitin deacetylase (PgdA/CDA1 family)